MNWTVLFLMYRNAPGGKTLWSKDLDRARRARAAFATALQTYSEARVTLSFDEHVVDTLGTVTPVDARHVWPSPSDTRREIEALAPWGAYDFIFAIAHYEGHNYGLYTPDDTRGAAYATLPGQADLEVCGGDALFHEFLHGAATFFMHRGWSMPKGGDSEDGVHAGPAYYNLPPSCWGPVFYRAFVRGEVGAPGERLGIPLGAWELGSPRDAGRLAGLHSTDPDGFAREYREHLRPAWPFSRHAYPVDGGERQDFKLGGHVSTIYKGRGLPPFAMTPPLRKAYDQRGGPKRLGFPRSRHRGSGGQYLEVHGFDGRTWVAGADGAPRAYLVGGRILLHYEGLGGPSSYLGYPTSDLYTSNRDRFIVQDFRGGRVWIDLDTNQAGDAPWGAEELAAMPTDAAPSEVAAQAHDAIGPEGVPPFVPPPCRSMA